MPEFPQSIIDSILGNIKYRENVVTGEIVVDNGNYTYDVKIAGEDTAIKYIHTNQKHPEYSTGDSVLLNLEYGSKDMPIIIGYGKKIIQEIIDVDMNVLVTTLDAYSITETTAYLEGRIEDIEGYEKVTRRGFYYGTSTGYGSDAYSTGSFEAGSYNKQVTSLTKNTAYHFQAYVHDADGDVQIGEDKTMTTTLENIIFVLYETDAHYCKTFTKSDGSLISTISISENVYWETDTFCVDSANNFYYLDMSDVLYKKGSTGNAITSKNVGTAPESIAIGADGYLYCREQGNTITKRNAFDLESVETAVTLSSGGSYYGLVMDSNGYFYVSDNTNDQMEKWSTTGQIAIRSIADGNANSLSIVSNTIARAYNAGGHGAWSMPTNLGSAESDFALGEIDDNVVSASSIEGTHFLFVGDNDSGNVQFEKYTSAKVLDYAKEIETSETWNAYSHIAAYPF